MCMHARAHREGEIIIFLLGRPTISHKTFLLLQGSVCYVITHSISGKGSDWFTRTHELCAHRNYSFPFGLRIIIIRSYYRVVFSTKWLVCFMKKIS